MEPILTKTHWIEILMLSWIMGFNSSATSLDFDKDCSAESQFIVGAVGDFLMHGSLQKKAAEQKSFTPLWQKFLTYTNGVDAMYGNLETPSAMGLDKQWKETAEPSTMYDDSVYSSYPMFNAHGQLLADIKNSGFDIVSTANNHSLDRGPRGIDRTIDQLENVTLSFSGTKRRNDGQKAWAKIVENKNWRVAFISCTFFTNVGEDKYHQVLLCDKDYKVIAQEIHDLKNSTDAVVVTPHWGNEYELEPTSIQKKYAQNFLDEGALLVLGAHPHVLQPFEKYKTKDGRDGFIAYSLANFIASQPSTPRKTSIMLFTTLLKEKTGKVKVGLVEYLPTFMKNHTGNFMDIEVLPILPDKKFGQDGLKLIHSLLPIENTLYYGQVPGMKKHCGT